MTPETEGKWIECSSRLHWLAMRRDLIGSSDVPAILGVGYEGTSPMTVYADKVGGEPTIDKATRKMYERGHLAERFIIQLFGLEKDLYPVHSAIPSICRHRDIDFLGASLDGYVIEDGEHKALEAKLIMHDWMEWHDGPPLKHVVQVQHQLWCTGWQRGYLVGWDGKELHIHTIERDEKLLELLDDHLTAFWHRHVVPRVPPPPDGSEACAKALLRLYPKDDGSIVELGTEELKLYQQLKVLADWEKMIKEKTTAAKNKLRAALGDVSYGVLPNGAAVSWKTQTRKGYYVEPGESRVLRLHDKLPKGAKEVR